MTSTHQTQSSHAGPGRSHRAGACCGKGHWSATNIVAMVLGFILFWPLGLAVLAWSFTGHPIEELPGWLRDKWRQLKGHKAPCQRGSDNVVFDEYQQAQHDRIDEIKEEIRRRGEAFQEFRSDTRRRQDQAEFDDFMSTSPGQRPASD